MIHLNLMCWQAVCESRKKAFLQEWIIWMWTPWLMSYFNYKSASCEKQLKKRGKSGFFKDEINDGKKLYCAQNTLFEIILYSRLSMWYNNSYYFIALSINSWRIIMQDQQRKTREKIQELVGEQYKKPLWKPLILTILCTTARVPLILHCIW